ncbi:MAG: tRNA lysidine(34) synthetase TilS [Syntrophomonadaceae bacterium]|jgi:tRNA(Ile)-lysidine synthase
MLRQVEQFITAQGLLAKGEGVVVAVSGGPDSMALLHIMRQLKSPWNLNLIAAHVHHGLRTEAEHDLERVQTQCRAWGIKLELSRADIAHLARVEKRSLEEMGRIYRYRFFTEVMEKHQAQRIATAHHKEDNAESILLHLLRGSGSRGMRGILPLNQHIIRPLLCVSKAQIMNYLQEQQIPYGWDASNMDSGFTRNRIRNELIPYLQEHFNPRLVDSLNRFAEIARQEDKWMQDLTELLWQQVVTVHKDSLQVAVKPFLKAPPAAQRRLVLDLCCHLLGSEGWEKSHIDSIIKLAQRAGSSRYLRLKRGLRIYKIYEKLVFTTQEPKKVKFNYRISVPGQILIEETGELLRYFVLPREQYTPHDEDTCLDWEQLLFALETEGFFQTREPSPSPCLEEPLYLPLFIRSRLPGDRFTPPEASTPAKLKEYFIENKIPWADRDRIPLLASSGRVFAILGQAVDKDVRVSSQTAHILVIKRERLNGNKATADQAPSST